MKYVKLAFAGIGIVLAFAALLKWIAYDVALPLVFVILAVLFFMNGYEAYSNKKKILSAIYTLAAVFILGIVITRLFL